MFVLLLEAALKLVEAARYADNCPSCISLRRYEKPVLQRRSEQTEAGLIVLRAALEPERHLRIRPESVK
jgi:hypothetical protein